MKPSSKEPLDPEAALLKLRNYCAYQERCHQEVEVKLAQLGFHGFKADAIMARLIEENFLNEERFAVAFAGGKYRIKNWGKYRIRLALQQKGVSEYSIDKALEAVKKEGDYEARLTQLLASKKEEYKGRTQQWAEVALRKGWEAELVWEIIRQLGEA